MLHGIVTPHSAQNISVLQDPQEIAAAVALSGVARIVAARHRGRERLGVFPPRRARTGSVPPLAPPPQGSGSLFGSPRHGFPTSAGAFSGSQVFMMWRPGPVASRSVPFRPGCFADRRRAATILAPRVPLPPSSPTSGGEYFPPPLKSA